MTTARGPGNATAGDVTAWTAIPGDAVTHPAPAAGAWRRKWGRAVRWSWRLLVDGAILLPIVLTSAGALLAARPDRAAGLLGRLADRSRSVSAGGRRPASLLLAVLLLLPEGALALFAVVVLVLDEPRVLALYWWTDAGTLGAQTWGGPTMAGAWAVHAAVGVAILPLLGVVLVVVRAVSRTTVSRLVLGERPGRWALTCSAGLAAVAVVVFWALTHQS